MNTNIEGLDDFQKSSHPCALDLSCVSNGRVNHIILLKLSQI